MALDQQGLTITPATETPMTIAGFNTVFLSIAATLCGLFTVLALSVWQIRNEAREALLLVLRLFGFCFAYLVIGVVYIPIRVLDCVQRTWNYYYPYDDDEDEGGGCASIPSSKKKVRFIDEQGGGGISISISQNDADAEGYGYYDDGPSRTRRDLPLTGGGKHYAAAAASSSKYTRSSIDIIALDLAGASDLEKGVLLMTSRNRTKPPC